MSYYEAIYEYAADNYGLITSSVAHSLGIPGIELVKLAHRGKLWRVGHGVYRIEHYVPTPLDKYAEAIALVGDSAYIYGESVLAMYGLAYANPPVIYVASPKLIRKRLPSHIKVVRGTYNVSTQYEGIATQKLDDAIIACKSSVMTERLEEAAKDAAAYGFVTEEEALQVREELRPYER